MIAHNLSEAMRCENIEFQSKFEGIISSTSSYTDIVFHLGPKINQNDSMV